MPKGVFPGRHGPLPASAEERFWKKVDIRGPDECWPYKGSINKVTGYGQFGVKTGKNVPAHLFAYTSVKGLMPKGKEASHTCSLKPCCNPAHIIPETHKENLARSANVITTMHARKTHCAHGHPFSPENTRIDRKGGRQCISCTDARLAASRERTRQARAQRPPPTQFRCGHSRSRENTLTEPSGTERCKICTRASQRRYWEQRISKHRWRQKKKGDS